nr:hypothetical protein [Salmonella enterica]
MTEPLHLVLPGRGAPVRIKKIRDNRKSDLGRKAGQKINIKTKVND